MPKRVQVAIALMWVVWIFGVFYGMWAWFVTRSEFVAMLPFAIMLALLALLIREVMRGRNWARIAYTCFVVISIVTAVRTSLDYGFSELGEFLIRCVLVVVYAATLMQLFHPTSRAWFTRPEANAI